MASELYERDVFLDTKPTIGVLRSRLVARLSGVTVDQLHDWQRDDLLNASMASGSRGHVRLYSWTDYIKARIIHKLLLSKVKRRDLNAAIRILEETVPDWYRAPLEAFNRQVLLVNTYKTVASAVQFAIPEVVEHVLGQIQEEGPLGELRAFGDVVTMTPYVFGGNPIIKETRLETQFISELVKRGVNPEQVAHIYGLTDKQVVGALAFTQAVAA